MRVFAGDETVFTDSYLRAKFLAWQNARNPISLGATACNVQDGYVECEIRADFPQNKPAEGLKFIFSSAGPARIIDIRKSLRTESPGETPDQGAVLDFVERFLWVYETGNDAFLLDMLYPEHLQIIYQKNNSNQVVLNSLRRLYPNELPVSGIEWTRNGDIVQIQIIPEGIGSPIFLELNLKEYLSAADFILEDRQTRVESMIAEIEGCLAGTDKRTQQENPCTSIDIAQSYFSEYLVGYELSFSQNNGKEMKLNARAPVFDGIRPADLNMRITRYACPNGGFRFDWSITSPFGNNFGRSQIPPARKNDVENLFRRHTVDVMLTPGPVDHILDTNSNGILEIRGRRSAVFSWTGPEKYNSLLKTLAKQATIYFFPSQIRLKDERMIVEAYSIIQPTGYSFYHLLSIAEEFVPKEDFPNTTRLELYPFIRTDYLTALINSQPAGDRKPVKIRIKR